MKFTRFGKMVCVGLLAVTTAIGSMCMASAATNTNTGEKAEYFQYGDVNMDGRVSVIDRTMIQKFIAGMETPTKEQERLADVDGDGKVTREDAVHIQEYIVRLYTNDIIGTESNVPVII